ncbi:MAG TPA: hypothetical protein VH331_04690 [Allosphingosinicella sp.]|jgi:hypothetical protein|nr:hypothetical protein [Allosphingosinicella sp.]
MTWLLATAAIGMAYAVPANAQATRTWVSGFGDDANPCSRTAPCKTFQGALSKTAAGGEMNCIDAGGYGSVTITKAMTINCYYTLASVLHSGTQGIVINAGPNDQIVLNGIETNGAGTTPGTRGISFLAGGTLIVRDSFIYGSQTSPAVGISFTPSGVSKLYVERSTVANNGASGTGGGILIQPTGAGGSAKVEIEDSQVINSGGYGLRVDSTANTSTAGISVNIDHSQVSGSTGAGIVAVAVGTNPITMMIANSVSSNNTTNGIIGNGAQVTIRVGNTTITGNATGINPAGGSTISSYGDNRLDGNTTANGAFTGAILPKS